MSVAPVMGQQIEPRVTGNGWSGGSSSSWTPRGAAEVERDREVGRRGEELVYRMELERVRAMGHERPEDLVIWTSRVDPGADHDIRSVAEDRRVRWIEVKSTTGTDGRFEWSRKEFEKALREGDRYELWRVSDTAKQVITALISSEILRAASSKTDRVRPCFLVYEEAHNFAPAGEPAVSHRIIKKIAGEGRKFGVGFAVVSQRPSKLDPDVTSQCNTLIAMRLRNPDDQRFIAKTSDMVKPRQDLAEVVHFEAVELKRQLLVRPSVLLAEGRILRGIDRDTCPRFAHACEGLANCRNSRLVVLIVELIGALVEAELATLRCPPVFAVRIEDDDRSVVQRDEPLDDTSDGVRLA